jgi:hypothetical protein
LLCFSTATLPRLDLGEKPRTWLGPGFFRNLLELFDRDHTDCEGCLPDVCSILTSFLVIAWEGLSQPQRDRGR